MYLWKSDAQSTAPQRRFLADETLDAARQAAARESQSGCRIGVVIGDDYSSSDVVQVLARTCEHFGTQRGPDTHVGKFSITIIAARSGFVLRENACLPVWCEAIRDVDPLRFHYFVVPKSGHGASEPSPEIVEWLARAGASGKMIVLSPEVGAARASEPQAAAQVSSASVAPEHHASESAQDETIANGAAEAARAGDPSQASCVLEKTTPSERIRATVAWLNENYGTRISISDMAERALMSERNFLRRFRAEMGHTPHEYLSQIRLESARQLLVTTALPVDKIARHCGLFNGDHLRKHFLKRFSMSPAEYRTAHFHALHTLGGADAGADPKSDPTSDR